MKCLLPVLLLATSALTHAAPDTAYEQALDLVSAEKKLTPVMVAGNDRQRGVKTVERIEAAEKTASRTTGATGKNSRKKKLNSSRAQPHRERVAEISGSAKSGKMKHAKHDGAKGRRAKKKERVADALDSHTEKVN